MLSQTVRQVLPHEYCKYRAHLKALDHCSKTLRFANPLSDDVIDNLCDKWESDYVHNILFCVEDSNLEFIAVAHIAVHEEMELALSVLKEYQGHGLGSSLMKRAIQWCRTHNILKGNMICLSTNQVVKHLCAKHGIHTRSEQGETTANIELDTPSIETFISEAVESNIAAIDYMSKRLTSPWVFNK
jgi:GNAT superfamily N-acetyltransferase